MIRGFRFHDTQISDSSEIQTGNAFGRNDPLPEQYHKGSWVFFLEELDDLDDVQEVFTNLC